MHTAGDSDGSSLAARFRAARLAGTILPAFPGALPVDLGAAYAVQDEAIAAWPDRLAGWKVAGIAPEFRESLGASRLCGPVFSQRVFDAGPGGPVRVAVFDGGFAAVEAEFILRIGRDIPPSLGHDAEALAACVSSLHVGMEVASSPFAGLNAAGPLSVISDFGNNWGLVVGEAIDDWQQRPLEALTSRAHINGEVVGEGSAANLVGGPLGALAALVGILAGRGRSLSAGDYVSTGMTTGIHAVRPGDRIRMEFCDGLAFEAIADRESAAGRKV